MAVFNEPAQWDHTLGNNADTSTLPDDSAATAGTASLQKLFQIINATPLEAGGIAPDREDVNALFKYLGDSIFYAMNGGVPSYNAAYDYVPGRVVLYTDNNLYKCIQANGASSTVVAPGTDDAYWQQLDGENTSTSLIPNQLIISPVPLTDANLHLLDGALLSGSGAYSEYVDLIAEIYNSGDATTSFCTEAEWQTSNTNYGFCNKFVYDSVANTVRLPKINSEHGALIKSYANGNDWFRIYQDGFCEQGGYIPAQSSTAQQRHVFIQPFTSNVSAIITNTSNDGNSSAHNLMINVDVLGFDFHSGQTENNNWSATNNNWWLASGYVDISDLQTAPIYEYIVVGTVSKTQIQIDIDNVMADLANKADTDLSNVPSSKGILVESYVNGASWYRVYSDGWCEQGGYATASGSNASVTYLKAFNSTDYTLTFGIISNVTNNCYLAHVGEYANTTHASSTGFTALAFSQKAFNWMACGYIS